MAAQGEREAQVVGRQAASSPVGRSPFEGSDDAAAEQRPLEPSKSKASVSMERAGTMLQRAASLQLQRADSLPESDADLRHAATMPSLMDVQADRPFCGGLWKTQQLVGAVLGVVLAVVFLAHRMIHEYSKASAMLAVFCLTGCFWLFEVVPIYITALLPVILMPLFEITSTDIAASAYWNWVQLLFVGAFLIDVAMEHVQLPRRMMVHLLVKTGTSAWAVLASFMFVAWALSMVCSDIAITLMLAPFATGLLNTAEEEAAGLDAAAAHEGGGSSGGGPTANDRFSDGPKVLEVRRFGRGLLLGIAYASSAGGLATTIGTPANALLAGQAILEGQLKFVHWFLFALPISACTAIVAFLVLYLVHVRGASLPLSREVLLAEHDSLVSEIGHFSRDELLVGAIQILLLLLLCLQPLIDRVVTNPLRQPLSGSATTACLCAFLLFLVPSKARPGEALLTWRAAHEKLPWGVLLLIGGGFSLARGFQESGLDIALGHAIGRMLPGMPHLTLQFVVVFAVLVLIQLMNSIATAAWVLPVLVSASASSLTNPMRLLPAATVACSFSFVLPTASPANAIILGKSRDLAAPLRIRDFLQSGIPVTLLAGVLGAFLIQALSNSVLDASQPFPMYACEQSNCVWASVPGVVEGHAVQGQACALLDEFDGALCQTLDGNRYRVDGVTIGPDVAPPVPAASNGGAAPDAAAPVPTASNGSAVPQPEAPMPSPDVGNGTAAREPVPHKGP